jgi:nitrogen-specific signal transduction histidine kinase
MSATHAVLVQAPDYFANTTSEGVAAEETIRELVHDLRQPLSSIEAIAYYLEMTLPADQFQARQYMRRLQQLVDQTSSILDQAATECKCKGPARSGRL